MRFLLSGVGPRLAAPLAVYVTGATGDALREAEALLQGCPKCELVEVFARSYFVCDLSRQPKDRPCDSSSGRHSPFRLGW